MARGHMTAGAAVRDGVRQFPHLPDHFARVGHRTATNPLASSWSDPQRGDYGSPFRFRAGWLLAGPGMTANYAQASS
jgi:hypothetical protein